MDKQTLKAVKELHQQLQQVDSLKERDRELVDRLRRDIESLLAHTGEGRASERESVIGQLEDAVGRFEVSHPDLTAVMSRVIKALSDMGI
jgi:hypothetical protein